MHSGNDQVTRLRGIESQPHSFPVTQFAHNDHIRIFAQHINETLFKRKHVGTEFTLFDERIFRLKAILYWIFQRDNMCLTVFIDVVDNRRNGCCLAYSCRAADKDEAGLDLGNIMERMMEIEFLDCRYITRKNPDSHTYSPHGGENVDPEAGIASGNSKVNGFFLPQFFQLPGCQEFSGQIIDFLM